MACDRCLSALQYQNDLINSEDTKLGYIVRGKKPPPSASHHLLKTFRHHQYAKDLKAAAETGCYMCSALWNTINDAERARLLEADASVDDTPLAELLGVSLCSLCDAQLFADFGGDVFGVGDEECLICMLRITREGFSASPPNRLMAIIMALPVDGPKAQQYVPLEPAPQVSDASWALAKRWIRNCISRHEQCGKMRSADEWYPTRLVEVSHAGNAHPRLILTSETRLAGPYITLSHRWGSARFLTLTLDRLYELKEAIPLSELPASFTDAFLVAEKLSVRYIWVDSLCIIQDSHVDWAREAAQMGRVYSHSLCNISCTGALDASEGLFLDQRLPILDPPEIEVRWRKPGSEDVLTAAPYRFIRLDYWGYQVSDRLLNRRAWVVQERVLSPRVLHFGHHQLLWECCEQSACEQYPLKMPPWMGDGFKNPGLSFTDPNASGKDDSKRLDNNDCQLIRFWHRIAQNYSAASLTIPSDKTVAISGLVSTLCTLLPGHTHIAGIWLSHLATELAWNVMDCSQADGSPSVIPLPPRAPSFSWLKLDGRIWLQGPEEDPPSLISLVGWSGSPAGDGRDNVLALSTGMLRLAGCLKRVRLVRLVTCSQPMWTMVVRAVAEEGKFLVGFQELDEVMAADTQSVSPLPSTPPLLPRLPPSVIPASPSPPPELSPYPLSNSFPGSPSLSALPSLPSSPPPQASPLRTASSCPPDPPPMSLAGTLLAMACFPTLSDDIAANFPFVLEENFQEDASWLPMTSVAQMDIMVPDIVLDTGLCALPLLGPTEEFPMVRGIILAHLPTYNAVNGTQAERGTFARIGSFLVTGKEAVSFIIEPNQADRESPCEFFDENTDRSIFTIM